jgi:hypothetical protein
MPLAGQPITARMQCSKAATRYGELPSTAWRLAPGEFRSFSSAFSLQVSEDPNAAPEPITLGYALGRNALADMLEQHRAMGVHHVMFNLTATGRPVSDVLEELAQEILPLFQDGR